MIDGVKTLVNVDTRKPADTYWQHGWYWYPHVKLMNHPSADEKLVWWPNTSEAKQRFGLNTYGPDIELEFAFDFMERSRKEGRPFFIYHTTHLGHDAFDWFNPASKSKWPGTPIVKWDGEKYTRTEPYVTGDNGVYDTHGTVTEPGIHNHINYIDYQVWLYMEKLKELGVADDTVFIFTADNGTSGYGKNSSQQQRGCHVPMIIHAPGMTKHGEQDVLVSLADILPTIAELVGVDIPVDYEINGESLVPFLFTDKDEHRNWLYTHRGPEQLARGKNVLRDGRHKWWDVTEEPDDLTSYPEITDRDSASDRRRSEQDTLLTVMPRFDLYDSEHEAPGIPNQPVTGKGAYFKGKAR